MSGGQEEVGGMGEEVGHGFGFGLWGGGGGRGELGEEVWEVIEGSDGA